MDLNSQLDNDLLELKPRSHSVGLNCSDWFLSLSSSKITITLNFCFLWNQSCLCLYIYSYTNILNWSGVNVVTLSWNKLQVQPFITTIPALWSWLMILFTYPSVFTQPNHDALIYITISTRVITVATTSIVNTITILVKTNVSLPSLPIAISASTFSQAWGERASAVPVSIVFSFIRFF